MALGTYIALGVNGPLAASDLFTILTVVVRSSAPARPKRLFFRVHILTKLVLIPRLTSRHLYFLFYFPGNVQNLLTLPISTIGHVAPQLLASFASFKRIANFLAAEEKQAQASGGNEGPSVPSPSLEGGDIVLKGAGFAVEKGGQDILKGLDVVLGRGKITMLVGPVGSVRRRTSSLQFSSSHLTLPG